MKVMIIILCLAVIVLKGCSTSRKDTHITQAINNDLPTIDQGNLNECLALSGGGIRSGAVSLGVLQRLHEIGKLERFQVVSTVSGGGLPVYGLIYNKFKKGLSLKKLLDEKGDYIQYVEQNSIYMGQTFIDELSSTFLNYIFTLPIRIFNSSDSIKRSLSNSVYRSSIHELFGDDSAYFNSEMSLRDIQIGENSDFPYPIFLVSSHKGRIPLIGKNTYKAASYFELSPNWIGAKEFGFWSSYTSDLTILDAATMSAAAIDTPESENQKELLSKTLKKQNIGLGGAVPLPDGNQVYLTDGGFIDNQGVLNLIERGCNSILVLDASQDSKSSFSDWTRVREKLFTSKSDWSLDTGNLPKGDSNSGWDLREHIWKLTATNKKLNQSIDIHIMKLGISKSRFNSYPKTVTDFASGNWRKFENNLDCIGNGLKERCPFPIESTMRQCFDAEEFRAYRHLGKYLVDLRYRTHDKKTKYSLENIEQKNRCDEFIKIKISIG